MPRQYVANGARAAMAILATLIASHALRYYGVLGHVWLGIDPKLRAVIEHAPVQALTHMLIAPIALLVGPFQFYPQLRARYPTLHRVAGRLYVAACLIAGVGALATAPYASGGPVAGFGFGLLAICWIATTCAAWRAAVRRDFARHRLLMRFSYAMTFAAATLRLQIPIGLALGASSYSAMSPWLAYTSWIPNVILVALYSTAEKRRRLAIAAE
ncbi:DUF2306 domain-containing protein [Methylovirgula sp. 4M-Z18]|uniref:DUF2306 domain-containing protein n=1 Tax=Methylovirgula sp. 4M-Z18 TaxID=2293567 RepID=UPI000E2EF93B|nr:DUF2306 domain-containing protein [Methylovirgula sp. 4M-Z18]RFB75685.1 DUF2306 domain-containing protein [Methylovirgula sp. 4M-Z18]